MNERDLERACHGVLMAMLAPMPMLWHINDPTTGGQPDTEVVWHGHTSKIEFKKLKANETVHDKWEDGRQLITCVKYERLGGGRCWIVAYHVKNDQTLIYRPSKLLDQKLPKSEFKLKVGWDLESKELDRLWNGGVLEIAGLTEGHRAVAALIRETHK